MKLAFTINDLMAAAGVSRRKIYEAINAGTLKARKNGKRTVVLAADAEAWLNALPALQPRGRA